MIVLGGSLSAAVIDRDEVDRQLNRLDHELQKRDSYISERQNRIDSLRQVVINRGQHDRRWLDDVMVLAANYNSFNIDSALYYYSAGYMRAQELGLDSLATVFKLQRATVYPVVGFIKNAMEDFESIDTLQMAPDLKLLYNASGRQMYSYIGSFYINYPAEHDHYNKLTLDRQLALLALLPQDSPRYKLNLGEYFFAQQEYTKAKVVLDELIAELPEDDNMYARAAHILSDIAKARGNNYEYVYYLILSAIGDIKSATLEVNSLQQLGRLLFDQGDVERAHTYLIYALGAAVRGHATMRMIQTAESMPIIEDAHRQELEKGQRNMYIVIGIMAVLVLVLIGVVIFIRLEMRRMAELQRRLESVNQIKDVYLSQFLQLCSIYMDKLNQLCKMTARKISAGQVDELYRMTKSGKFVEEQTRDFYEVFDNAFQHIYPTFVDNVNALLRPDEQIVLEEGEKMNTDLRILAFMRLGIEDSSKIAQVLNYSINTIYTYRNKLKNRAIVRETFEADVMKISSIN